VAGSIASGVATPSITQKIASLIIGMSTRFDTNPGASFTSTGVLPNAFATSTTSATVLSAVSSPRTTSTSGMTGTGFMKCIPITCAGRLVWAAIAVMEMEEVLLARIAAGGASRSMSRKILNLTSGCSVAASTTSRASATESRLIEVRIRASAASRCSAVTDPFFTCRSRFVLMTASTRSSKPGATSISVVSQPCWANTCAMPFPIVPAPTTATRLMPQTKRAPSQARAHGTDRGPQQQHRDDQFRQVAGQERQRAEPDRTGAAAGQNRELGEPAQGNENQPRGHGERDSRDAPAIDRKSTRLNSSHTVISYAVFCLKK